MYNKMPIIEYVYTFELTNVSKFQIPFGQFVIDFFEAFQSCTECLQSFNLKGEKYGVIISVY